MQRLGIVQSSEGLAYKLRNHSKPEFPLMDGITTRLHWTDKAYKWHVYDGQEVFVVLDGQVEMQYKQEDEVKSALLNAGDIFYASIGTEHIAVKREFWWLKKMVAFST